MAERILVVEGEAVVRDTVARILTREGFYVEVAPDAEAARALARSAAELAVVVAGDDGPDGVAAIRHVREAHPQVRAIWIAPPAEPAIGRLAHQLGVDGLLERPIDLEALRATIGEALTSLKLERERAAMLERLRANVVTMVDSLARALEDRDPYTAGHSQRVAAYSVMIGEDLGLSSFELEVLRHGAALHDIGKIAVRQDVLNKPGRLNDDEYEHIKSHPVVGREILSPIEDFKEMLDLVYYHHERIDGRGYPEGLAGDRIPQMAQIVAVADTYDAMTSDRPYRRGMPPERALAIMIEVAGTQLNGDYVAILARKIRQTIGATAPQERHVAIERHA